MARRVLKRGAGAVICLGCGTTASADGQGNGIILRCPESCPVDQEFKAAQAELDKEDAEELDSHE